MVLKKGRVCGFKIKLKSMRVIPTLSCVGGANRKLAWKKKTQTQGSAERWNERQMLKEAVGKVWTSTLAIPNRPSFPYNKPNLIVGNIFVGGVTSEKQIGSCLAQKRVWFSSACLKSTYWTTGVLLSGLSKRNRQTTDLFQEGENETQKYFTVAVRLRNCFPIVAKITLDGYTSKSSLLWCLS